MSHRGVALDHPLNAEIIAYLTRRPSDAERADAIQTLERQLKRAPSPLLAKALAKLRDDTPDPPLAPSQAPDGVNVMTLGALPEIVQRLWSVGRSLPSDCRWVAYRRAVLVHPRTGIIFGLAVGTFGIALRLPNASSAAAEAAGATQRLTNKAGLSDKVISSREMGEGWWFCPRVGDPGELALLAYDGFGAQ